MKASVRTTIIAIILLAAALLAMLPGGSRGALFKNDNFEDNLAIAYVPAIPYEYKEVNVTVRSLHGVALVSAELWIDIKGAEYTSSGAYPMERVNSTARAVTIPGYASGTNVTFHVTAYDGARLLTSGKMYYDVAARLSWRHSTFEQNLDLEFAPGVPTESEMVSVMIDSRDPGVKVRRADLNMSVKFPDFDNSISSAVSMTRINDYSFGTDIRDYPGGTEVSFRITAYDEYWTPMESREFKYTVEMPPEEFRYGIFVVVFNNITGQYVEANVSVHSDAGYLASGSTVNGIYWTPTDLTDGRYVIEATPLDPEEGEKKTKRVIVDRHTADLKFWVYYDLEDVSTGFPMESFPTTKVLVSFIAVGMLFPAAFLTLRERDKAREMERKKESERKRSEAETGKGKKKNEKIKPGGSVKNPVKAEKGPLDVLLNRLKWVRDRAFESVEMKKNVGTAGAFVVLGFFGALWCPFYPWWMVVLISLVTGAIAFRLPYLSLIFVSFAAIGSTAFQSPQFGFMFMMFSLIVCVASLFSWKFGYLSLLMVFLSTFGLSILVPVLALMLFSVYLSVTVTVVSGLFLSVIASTSNLVNLSFITSSYATDKDSIVTFSRDMAGETFTPRLYLGAIMEIQDIKLSTTWSFIQGHMTSMVPIIQVLFWILVVIALFMVHRKLEEASRDRSIFFLSLSAFGILTVSNLGGMALAHHTAGTMFHWKAVVVYVLLLPALMLAVTLAFLIRSAFAEFYSDQTGVKIGTRISDLMNFRRTSFRKVGGLTDVKDEIKDSMIGPLLSPEISRAYGVEPPKGMILFGPPGCGKTLLMRVIASELNVEMIGVKCSDIMSKWYGESENLINDLFKTAREKRPCVLFLDEIDAIAKRRDFYSADDVTPRLLSIMLSEMDGMDEFSEIIIIGATNRPELVDPALLRPGRFDKIIYVPPPDLDSRVEILKIHMKGKPSSRDIDLLEVAEKTGGYSGADLANLARECATNAMRRHIRTKKSTRITMTDLRDVVEILKPSLTREMLDEYEQLQVSFERKLKQGAIRDEKRTRSRKRKSGMKHRKEQFDRPGTGKKGRKGKKSDGRRAGPRKSGDGRAKVKKEGGGRVRARKDGSVEKNDRRRDDGYYNDNYDDGYEGGYEGGYKDDYDDDYDDNYDDEHGDGRDGRVEPDPRDPKGNGQPVFGEKLRWE